jgi:hypothetical protein
VAPKTTVFAGKLSGSSGSRPGSLLAGAGGSHSATGNALGPTSPCSRRATQLLVDSSALPRRARRRRAPGRRDVNGRAGPPKR